METNKSSEYYSLEDRLSWKRASEIIMSLVWQNRLPELNPENIKRQKDELTYDELKSKLSYFFRIKDWENYDTAFEDYVLNKDIEFEKNHAEADFRTTEDAITAIDEAGDITSIINILNSVNKSYVKWANDEAMEDVVNISLLCSHLAKVIKENPRKIITGNDDDLISLFKAIFDLKDHATVVLTIPWEILLNLITNQSITPSFLVKLAQNEWVPSEFSILIEAQRIALETSEKAIKLWKFTGNLATNIYGALTWKKKEE